MKFLVTFTLVAHLRPWLRNHSRSVNIPVIYKKRNLGIIINMMTTCFVLANHSYLSLHDRSIAQFPLRVSPHCADCLFNVLVNGMTVPSPASASCYSEIQSVSCIVVNVELFCLIHTSSPCHSQLGHRVRTDIK